jgi:hypothetical protein
MKPTTPKKIPGLGGDGNLSNLYQTAFNVSVQSVVSIVPLCSVSFRIGRPILIGDLLRNFPAYSVTFSIRNSKNGRSQS